MTGMVYFVGTGLGDPECLTVRALRILEQADVVLYDRYMHGRVIAYANAKAEKVAFESVEGSCRQQTIKQFMVERAKNGCCVVRLSNDDPFVLGGCGEEAEYLRAKQIPYEVIPGVLSMTAAMASAGIPMVYSQISSSFAVFADMRDHSLSTAWRPCGKCADTLLFFIQLEKLSDLLQQLLQNGYTPTTPVALIQRETTVKQRVEVGTIADFVAKMQGFSRKFPILVIIGKIVHLREKIQWTQQKPLLGQRILITRSQQQSKPLAEKIRALGGEPLIYPMIKMVPPRRQQQLDQALQQIKKYDWIIFTSVNGVKFFFQRMKEKKVDIRQLAQAKIAVVGPKTKKALEELGILVDCMPEEHVAEALVEALCSVISSGDKILLPRANIARNLLPIQLTKMGCEVDAVDAYDTVPAYENAAGMLKELQAGAIDLITFTSSSTVRYFQQMLAEVTPAWKETLAKVKIVCLGPVTAKTAREVGLTVDRVAKPYTIDGLVNAICTLQ